MSRRRRVGSCHRHSPPTLSRRSPSIGRRRIPLRGRVFDSRRALPEYNTRNPPPFVAEAGFPSRASGILPAPCGPVGLPAERRLGGARSAHATGIRRPLPLRGRVFDSRRVLPRSYKKPASVCCGSGFSKSGKRDSNPRPLAPHASALPDCATARFGCVNRLMRSTGEVYN